MSGRARPKLADGETLVLVRNTTEHLPLARKRKCLGAAVVAALCAFCLVSIQAATAKPDRVRATHAPPLPSQTSATHQPVVPPQAGSGGEAEGCCVTAATQGAGEASNAQTPSTNASPGEPVRPREASLSKNQSALSPSLCCARPASNAKSLHRRGLRCRASAGCQATQGSRPAAVRGVERGGRPAADTT